MTTAVERAAGVIRDHEYYHSSYECRCQRNEEYPPTMKGTEWAAHLAQALADAGIIPDGKSETRVEYGVRFSDGDIEEAKNLDNARDIASDYPEDAEHADETGYAVAIVQQTVTTHKSEWTEV